MPKECAASTATSQPAQVSQGEGSPVAGRQSYSIPEGQGSQLWLVSGGLGLMYAVLTFGHQVVLQGDAKNLMVRAAFVSSVLLLGLALWLAKRGHRSFAVHPVECGVGAVVLGNSLLHLWVAEGAQHSINILLLVVGFAGFMRSMPWYAGFVALALTGWALVVAYRIPDFDWVHYGFATFVTLALASLIFGSRRASRQRLESMRAAERAQSARLSEALAAARREIRERARVDAALSAAHERHSAIIEASTNGVLVVDHLGAIQEFNPAVEAILGYRRDAVVGKSAGEVFLPESLRGEYIAAFRRYQETGKAPILGRPIELPALRADGVEIRIELTIQEVATPAGTPEFVGYMRDLTESDERERALRAAKESAEDASEAKGQFLARMSHEIRTPLNAILGMAELVLAHELPGQLRTYIRRSLGAAEYLSSVLGDLLDLSKIEAEQLQIENRSVDIRELLEDSCGFLTARADRKGLVLSVSADSTVPPKIWGDPVRIRQVLTNLLANAIKYTETGWVAVCAECREGDVLINVIDTGPGVEKELQELIFEEFRQLPVATRTSSGGTGLGLSISRRLAQLMGGEIEYQSRAEGGSCFRFSLPLNSSESGGPANDELKGISVGVSLPLAIEAQCLRVNLEAAGATVVTVEQGGEGVFLREPDVIVSVKPPHDGGDQGACWVALSNLGECIAERQRARSILERPAGPVSSIAAVQRALGREVAPRADELANSEPLLETMDLLIVDDNETNQMILAEMLGRRGHRVSVAASGEEAVASCQVGSFDGILMDIEMPGMNGIEALRAIRQMEPHATTLILAVTAYATKELRQTTLEAGFDAFLSKPVRAADVIRALAEGRKEPVAPTFDGEALLAHVEGDRVLIAKLVTIFCRTAPLQLDEVEEAARAGDMEAVCQRIHKLSGTLGDMGGTSARLAAQKLGALARSGQLSGQLEKLDELRAEAALLTRALEDFVRQTPG